jgi:hypothetical protein
VAGPVYQAYLELQEQQFERERFTEVGSHVPAPPRVSGWWLLPPVKYQLCSGSSWSGWPASRSATSR